MSANVNPGLDRKLPDGQPGDVGEIYSQPLEGPATLVTRESLRSEEHLLSIPAGPASLVNPIAPLTKYLGPLLTIASPAWSGDPIPRMRALQKKLVEHSLKLEEGERKHCLEAITVVETAVRLRLRFQQMRMNEAELHMKPEARAEQ